MPKQSERKSQSGTSYTRRVRGKVQPPKVPQSNTYWDDLSKRALQDYERKVETVQPQEAAGEPVDAESSAFH